MRVQAALSAILKDAAPWRILLREYRNNHLNLVAVDAGNAMVWDLAVV